MEFFSMLLSLIFYAAISVSVILILVAIVLKFVTNPYPMVELFKEEQTYEDPKTNSKLSFPSLQDAFSVNLSVIVPAYNEEERLPPMLDEALEFLESRLIDYPKFKYEIIIVSDGSKDGTVEVAQKYAEKYGTEKVKCLRLIKNRGKGGAVRLGIYSARGAVILFADADGASKFEDLTCLEKSLSDLVKHDYITAPEKVCDKLAVVIASRANLEKESLAKRNIFRNLLMYGFHFLVWLFTVKGIRDTQCGFKLFTRRTAAVCFQSLHVNRWAFDVELLFIAQRLSIPITEIPIRWTEIEGSKVTPVLSWIQMGVDLGLIWLKYKIGAWRIKENLD